MTAATRSPRFALLMAGALLAALIAGACGAPAPSAAPSSLPSEAVVPPATPVAPAPTEAPAPTATPLPVPTEAPTPTTTPTASPAPTGTPGPAGAAGGQTGRISLDEIGLTLTLPKGWRSIPLTEEDVEDIIDTLPAGTLPAGFEDQVATLVASGLKLFAMDLQRANLGANVNVLAIPTEIPAGLLLPTAKIGISQLGGVRNVRYKDVEVDGEAALRVEYTVSIDVAGGRYTSTGIQLWIPWRGSTMAVTVTTPKGGQVADRDALVRSLRLD